jgi:hypothetical protein
LSKGYNNEELTCNGSQVGVEVVDLALELGVLVLKLVNVGFEVFLVLLLSEGEAVKAVNNFVSEIVKGFDDGAEGVLVSEVLVGGEADEGLDHG